VTVQVIQSRVQTRDERRFYYEVRKPEDNWGSPATLEEKVAVNFWGTLVSGSKIDFGGEDYVELTDSEMAAILVEDEESEGDSSHS
jgi:Large polyvalent protein associated domain 28